MWKGSALAALHCGRPPEPPIIYGSPPNIGKGNADISFWAIFSPYLMMTCVLTFSCVYAPSSGDQLQPWTERLLPSAAAGAHGRVPAHEDAQEDSGTPVVCVLRNLWPYGATYLHCKAAVFCICVSVCVCVLTSAGLPACDVFQFIHDLGAYLSQF